MPCYADLLDEDSEISDDEGARSRPQSVLVKFGGGKRWQNGSRKSETEMMMILKQWLMKHMAASAQNCCHCWNNGPSV